MDQIPYKLDGESFPDFVVRRKAALRKQLSGVIPHNRQIVLEIGAGHGHFLTAYAKEHPDEFCIGIDLRAHRIRRAERKKEQAGLENLAFVRCEAADFLECLPADVAFRRIFLLFPDPWPKKRHHKNRLISTNILDALSKRAIAGTRLFLRTDHEPFFEQARERIGEHPAWRLNDSLTWPFEAETVFQALAESYYSIAAERLEY